MTNRLDEAQIKKRPPILVDNPAVAEVFADNIVSLAFSYGNAVLTMGTARTDHSKEPSQTACVIQS
jgi:hypothetical protein